MLNPFPALFTFGFFAPTILRLAVAVALLYLAYRSWTHREKIAKLSFPLIGKQSWVGAFSAAVYGVVGIMLFVGYYTQIAALIGMLASIKGAVLDHRFQEVFPLSRSAYILLAVICLSLLLTGAGALAFDLPL